jgi:hypothetical protein
MYRGRRKKHQSDGDPQEPGTAVTEDDPVHRKPDDPGRKKVELGGENRHAQDDEEETPVVLQVRQQSEQERKRRAFRTGALTRPPPGTATLLPASANIHVAARTAGRISSAGSIATLCTGASGFGLFSLLGVVLLLRLSFRHDCSSFSDHETHEAIG